MREKKILVFDCVRVVLGLVLAVGSATFLAPCVHADGQFGTCHWAGQALIGFGIVLTIQAMTSVFSDSAKLREGISLSIIPVALLAALLPGSIIPLCGMATMRCNAIMKPAAVLIAVLICLLSAVDAVYQHKRARRENKA